jgi:dTDP-4-dehydrorhamnose 3,5-epimerase-like enzyme
MTESLANVSLEPRVLYGGVFQDSRGYFSEVIKKPYETIPGFDIRQVNASWSRAGVFRGLHAQVHMDKAMYVSSGKAIIFAVNIDPFSKLYGKVISEEMQAGDGKLFYAPWWWARGFIALTDATVTYFCSAPYNGKDEVAVNYRSFPEVEQAINKHDANIISEKDTISPLADHDTLELWVRNIK